MFGRQHRQVAAPKHQPGDQGTADVGESRPCERGGVAVEGGRLDRGRGLSPTDQVGRRRARGQGVEKRSSDRSSHLLRGVEGGRSDAGVVGYQPEGAGAERGGDAQS